MGKELAYYHKEFLDDTIKSLNNGRPYLKTVYLTPEMISYLEDNGVNVEHMYDILFKLTLKTETK